MKPSFFTHALRYLTSWGMFYCLLLCLVNGTALATHPNAQNAEYALATLLTVFYVELVRIGRDDKK